MPMRPGDLPPPTAAQAAPPDGPGGAEDPLIRLGRSLREARQARGLEPASLAGQLRMGVEQLEALEAGDRSRLPELVFVVAQARRIASHLDLDVAALVEPLRHQNQGPLRPAPAPRRRAGPGLGPTTAAPPWLLSAAAVALVGALAAAGWWGLTRLGGRLPLGSPGPTATTTTPADRPGLGSQSPAPASGGTPAATTGAGAQLVLRSAEPSWLAVRSVDGTDLFEGTLQGQRSFPLGQGLEVRAGRPDLVSAGVAGGPARTLGPIDQIRWWRFSPAAPPAPAPPP